MNTLRRKLRPKHQILVLKCYPQFQKTSPEVKPNSSELSYLLYYASTRRSKLQKVGAFLEKKTARDIRRNRIGYVPTLKHMTPLIAWHNVAIFKSLSKYSMRSLQNVPEICLYSQDLS